MWFRKKAKPVYGKPYVSVSPVGNGIAVTLNWDARGMPMIIVPLSGSAADYERARRWADEVVTDARVILSLEYRDAEAEQ